MRHLVVPRGARICLLSAAIVSILGCHSNPSDQSAPTPPQRSQTYTPPGPKDPWIIETRSWEGNSRGTYLGNGTGASSTSNTVGFWIAVY